MAIRMELVAGPVTEVVEQLTGDAESGFPKTEAFAAYLSLSGGIDPTWLDLFAESVRTATGLDGPTDFIDARIELGISNGSELTIERVDPSWISAVAAIPDGALDRIAGRWIDRLEDELGDLQPDEKPWIRELAGRVVTFCRAAERQDVVFVWGL